MQKWKGGNQTSWGKGGFLFPSVSRKGNTSEVTGDRRRVFLCYPPHGAAAASRHSATSKISQTVAVEYCHVHILSKWTLTKWVLWDQWMNWLLAQLCAGSAFSPSIYKKWLWQTTEYERCEVAAWCQVLSSTHKFVNIVLDEENKSYGQLKECPLFKA